MHRPLSIIGAPSSAGAYAPGQEKAPRALREAGLLARLVEHGIDVRDRGDVAPFRWQPDAERPRAMNADAAAGVAMAVAERVTSALGVDSKVLVIGGDCTVELGTVAGAASAGERLGLVYFDLDTDLNTPESSTDGALDWMGVAHLLGLPGTVEPLNALGSRRPMLEAEQILFFANGNVTASERAVIDERSMQEVPLERVVQDPAASASAVVRQWAPRFDRLLVHLDVDVLDFARLPLAENTRRHWGLNLAQVTTALSVLLEAPNLAALTVSEVNPDHGAADGSTLRAFGSSLAQAIGAAGGADA